MDTALWKDKYVDELTLEELAYAHLGRSSYYQLKDGILKSILPIVLQEINHVRRQEYSKNFIPIAGAFGVIEQIGFAYKRCDMEEFSNKDGSGIKKALYYFAGYEENGADTKTLYALRNSFLHTASLMSKSPYENQPNYYFQFDREIKSIIQYPNTPWDGDITTFKPKYSTLINPEMIIDLAKSIADSALDCLTKRELVIDLKDGKKELYFRFLKMFRDCR